MPTYVPLASSVIAVCGKNRLFEASSNKLFFLFHETHQSGHRELLPSPQ